MSRSPTSITRRTDSRIPWLTLCLVTANLVLAIQVTLGGGGLVEAYGFRASSPSLHSGLASLFLHWNVFHLLGNMLFVVVVGTAVERALGWWRYLIVYLFGGLTGVGLYWALHRLADGGGTLVGASACVAACIGFVSIRYGTQRVPLSAKVHVPIWSVVMVWLALQVLGIFVRLGDVSAGTGYAAHLGGLAFGLIMAFAFKAAATAEIDDAHELLTQSNGPDEALARAQSILDRRPDDAKAIAQAANASQALGDRTREIGYRLRQSAFDLEAALPRLGELKALRQIPALERMKMSSSVNAGLQSLLFKSVAGEDGPERPNAILELIALEPSGGWKEVLINEFAMHPAIEIARSRGLI